MIRGTTPTFEFELPFEVAQLKTAYITMKQRNKTVLEKELSSCKCEENVIILKLTQEETLMFTCGCETEIQIRAKTLSGDALASNVMKVDTDRILKEGVI